MYTALLFWLFLMLPAYVVTRYLARRELDSGLLGVVGVSYVFTFVILSPFSILAYLLKAPLIIFSSICVVLIIASLIEITRRKWWRETVKLLSQGLCVELFIILLDLVASAWSGALIGGDAVTHLARIRMLLDHGFNNSDPFVGQPHFFPIYHTNLLHALYATCSQLTGVFHTKVWFVSLAWSKLLVMSGAYFMVWCLFERRWVAWVAALFTLGSYGPVSFLLYPNRVAPLWLCAIIIGWSIQALHDTSSRHGPFKLAAAVLVLGQLHSLYVGFVCVILIPVMGFVAVYRFARRLPNYRVPALCGVAVLLSIPFPLIARNHLKNHNATTVRAEVDGQDRENEPKEPPSNRWISMKPRSGWGKLDGWSLFLIGGVALSLRGPRRKHAAVLLAMCGIVLLIYHVPPLYSAFLSMVGKKWIVGRLGFVLHLGFVGLGLAAYIYWSEKWLHVWWRRGLVIVSALVLGASFVPASHVLYTWGGYWDRVTANRTDRQLQLRLSLTAASISRKHIPKGATVLTEDWRGMGLAMVHDCYIVAPKGGGNGIKDIQTRRADLKTMLAPHTPWIRRRELLRKYNIRHYLPGSPQFEWAIPHSKHAIQYGPNKYIFVLDID